jgi:hypothetical protein
MRHILPLPRPAAAMCLDLAKARGEGILLLAGQRLAAEDQELMIEQGRVDAVQRSVG